MARIFIAYCHKDRTRLNELLTHLAPLEGEGVEWFCDQSITPGAYWRDKIDENIAACDAAILLVSAGFLASRFIRDVELPAILAAHQATGTIVIPLIARSCASSKHAWLPQIEARPKSKASLAAFRRKDERELELAAFVVELGDMLDGTPKTPPAQLAEEETRVEIILDGDYSLNDDRVIEAAEQALRRGLQSDKVKIIRRMTWSLKLVVQLPRSAAGRLKALTDRGFLSPPGLRVRDEVPEVDLYEFRGQLVLTDEVVAEIHGYPVKALNQAARRNPERFAAEDSTFQLSAKEWALLKSQDLRRPTGRGGRRTPPWVSTARGAMMMATVLETPAAVAASKLIVDVFVMAWAQRDASPPANADGVGDPDRVTCEIQRIKAVLARFPSRKAR